MRWEDIFWREDHLCLDGGLNENKRSLSHLIPLNTLTRVTDNRAVNTSLTHAVTRNTLHKCILHLHSRCAYQFMCMIYTSTTNISCDLFTSGNIFLKTTFPAGNYCKVPRGPERLCIYVRNLCTNQETRSSNLKG